MLGGPGWPWAGTRPLGHTIIHPFNDTQITHETCDLPRDGARAYLDEGRALRVGDKLGTPNLLPAALSVLLIQHSHWV